MKSRTVLIVVLIGVFIAAVSYALLREVAREEAELAASLSGVVEVDPALYAAGQADIVKTDRLALYLVELVEYARQLVGGNPGARVGDRQGHFVLRAAQRQGHRSAIGELEGVAEQIHHDPAQAFRIRPQSADARGIAALHGELDVGPCQRRNRCHAVPGETLHIDSLRADLYAARLDL